MCRCVNNTKQCEKVCLLSENSCGTGGIVYNDPSSNECCKCVAQSKKAIFVILFPVKAIAFNNFVFNDLLSLQCVNTKANLSSSESHGK